MKILCIFPHRFLSVAHNSAVLVGVAHHPLVEALPPGVRSAEGLLFEVAALEALLRHELGLLQGQRSVEAEGVLLGHGDALLHLGGGDQADVGGPVGGPHFRGGGHVRKLVDEGRRGSIGALQRSLLFFAQKSRGAVGTVVPAVLQPEKKYYYFKTTKNY